MTSGKNYRPDPETLRGKATPISLSDCVEFSSLSTGEKIPLIIRPVIDGVNLAAWIAHNLERIEDQLLKYGAILFRGFTLGNQLEFEQVVNQFSLPLTNYVEGATPRTQLSKYIYTSTEYPADQSIALHNELTYASNPPIRLWFFCIKPAEFGGETPIADVRRVYRRIDPLVRQRFVDKGWMLVRNYNEKLSLPWQTVFRSRDKAKVEEYCKASGIEWEWVGENHLRTMQIRPAAARHPKTKEWAWFNHIAFWHLSSLDSSVRDVMVADFKEDGVPYNTYYGDGSKIDDSVVEIIREAYRSETVYFPWHKGDVLMLDNLLVAHGRNPFQGQRKVLVAMAEEKKS